MTGKLQYVDRSSFFQQATNDAFRRGSLLEKLSLLVTMLFNMPIFLWRKSGNFSSDNTDLQQIADGVWQLRYWQGGNNTTILQASDGTLLMHNAPPCQDKTVAQLAALGELKVLLVPSVAHESFAWQWKQRCPELVVVAPAADRASIEESLPVDHTLDEARDLLAKYRISRTIDVPFTSHAEFVSVLDLGGGRSGLISYCGLGNVPRTAGALGLFGGFGGLRQFRMFTLIFVKDLFESDKFIHETLAGMSNVDLLLFMHGEPITGSDVAGQLRSAVVSRFAL